MSNYFVYLKLVLVHMLEIENSLLPGCAFSLLHMIVYVVNGFSLDTCRKLKTYLTVRSRHQRLVIVVPRPRLKGACS